MPLQPLEHLSKVLLKPGAKVLIFFDYARVSLANLHRDAMSGCDYLAHPIFIGNRVNSKGYNKNRGCQLNAMNGIFLIEMPSFSRHGSLAIKANERKRGARTSCHNR